MELAELGATIRRTRLASGISQAQMARMVGVSRATINYAETGALIWACKRTALRPACRRCWPPMWGCWAPIGHSSAGSTPPPLGRLICSAGMALGPRWPSKLSGAVKSTGSSN
ncbi:MAG: XRE family transcriptional regulator [Candidatus Nanopelagicales bacterium]|nr:XRE family transcriptional regulator [Candidatus Nanopelagicales bacterium]